MPGLGQWQPYKTHVQGGLPSGNFINGQFCILCAGPPYLHDIGSASVSDDASSGTDVVYPLGITQNVALSQNKAISRIFEIGSDRSYFITGRTVGQLSLSRVMYHGPSLLRCLYAYYGTGVQDGTYKIDSLFASAGATEAMNFPFVAGAGGGTSAALKESSVRLKDGLHGVRIPPGFDNLFINLASDLFSQPIGLLLMFRDNEENDVGAIYLEQCYVPAHSFAMDAQGLIIQESVGIQYERIVPIKGTAVKVVDTIVADTQALSY